MGRAPALHRMPAILKRCTMAETYGLKKKTRTGYSGYSVGKLDLVMVTVVFLQPLLITMLFQKSG
jgi:hypothetical protein